MVDGVGQTDAFPTAGGRVTLERGYRVPGPDGQVRYFRDLLTASAFTASTRGWERAPIVALSSAPNPPYDEFHG